MMTTIPYFKQEGGERTCGAASLSMVYASFGLQVSQAEIWRKISKPNGNGIVSSFTHLMAKDAIERGFDAVVVQAKNPLQLLRICKEQGLRVILNLRLNKSSPAGHYSVLTGIHASGVIVHDPMAEPSRHYGFGDLLEVWRPSVPVSEIVGNIAIVIGPRPAAQRDAHFCDVCDLGVPDHVPCQKCQHPVVLRPATAFGCAAAMCAERVWAAVCCPECDTLFTFHLEKPNGPRKPLPRDEEAIAAGIPAFDPFNVDQMYAEIDRLFDRLKRDNPDAQEALELDDVRTQVDFIYSQREPLRMAIAEAKAAMKQRGEELLAATKLAAAEQEAYEKRLDDLTRPGPPLDGAKLAMDLVTNLGFLLRRSP